MENPLFSQVSMSAAAGLPEPRADHAAAMAGLAVDLVAEFERLAARRDLASR